MGQTKQFEKLILLAGSSGAGKTTVIHLLEDLGFFYIENLPVSLLYDTIKNLKSNSLYIKVVIGLDPRSFEHDSRLYIDTISQLQNDDTDYDIWSLDADLDVLITRYNESRRRHPYTDTCNSLLASLSKEKEALKTFDLTASQSINTSQLTVSQLKSIVKNNLGSLGERQLQINVFSFGFKYSLPGKVDYLFDVRCLPNPYWDEKIRSDTGLDRSVIDFFSRYAEVEEMENDIFDFMVKRIPSFTNTDRSYLDIGIGCTGGHHRSVFLADKLAKRLDEIFNLVTIHHRDLQG